MHRQDERARPAFNMTIKINYKNGNSLVIKNVDKFYTYRSAHGLMLCINSPSQWDNIPISDILSINFEE